MSTKQFCLGHIPANGNSSATSDGICRVLANVYPWTQGQVTPQAEWGQGKKLVRFEDIFGNCIKWDNSFVQLICEGKLNE